MFVISCIVSGILLGVYHSEVRSGLEKDSKTILSLLVLMSVLITLLIFFVEK